VKLPVLATLISIFAFQICSPAAFAQGRPFPPSIVQGERAEEQGEKDIPPPMTQRRTPDLAKLKQNADELAALAQSVPHEFEQTTKGVLPKDLSDKLKRIEKLAKQLRSQISQ